MKFTRRATLALIGAAAVATPAFAAQPEVFSHGGAAIRGIDPVAYFDLNGPVQGNAAHSFSWKGADWHFSSAENKALFAADPASYAPQYGGYCAYAVSKGGTASTDPTAWTVHENKLYLNYPPTVLDLWRRDIPGNISKANNNWPDVLN